MLTTSTGIRYSIALCDKCMTLLIFDEDNAVTEVTGFTSVREILEYVDDEDRFNMYKNQKSG